MRDAGVHLQSVQRGLDAQNILAHIEERPRRRARGATYHIMVDNTAGVQHGVKSVTVDGKPLQGSVLPLAAEGAEVNVQVVMG